jgi:hypothetical protein
VYANVSISERGGQGEKVGDRKIIGGGSDENERRYQTPVYPKDKGIKYD